MLALAPLPRRSRFRRLAALLSVLITLACLVLPARAQWPAGFSSAPVGSGWVQPTGLAFAQDGRMFVWEKAGLVWLVTNGVKAPHPSIDIAEEVANWSDYGLLGFALDPDFLHNGHVYLGYVADFHHVRWFGTPAYDPAVSTPFHDTIARVTRYTLDLQSSHLHMIQGSRTVLVGESMTTGIPICFHSHGIGSLVFGSDGTLLVATGDGASFNQVDTGGPVPGSSNTALADGIIRPGEDVGAFRSQLVDSLSGKILRIDPATGDGVASNPFFDPLAPRDARSRMWALGLRNPFRMALQPGTGSTDPAAADPGRLWIGDVGWNGWEETDVCDAPGLDFGWPIYEGFGAHPLYAQVVVPNPDAQNPLFGVGGCTQKFFAFSDLLIQDTLGPTLWRNPCDTSQQVPSSVPHFVHRRPLFDWGHGAGPARTGIYQGTQPAVIQIGAPGAPIAGEQFAGHCSTGGTWYTGTDFPPAWRDSYYFADYVHGWIRQVVVGAQGAATEVRAFGAGGVVSGVVALAGDPAGGGLYYIRYAPGGGVSEVRHVFHAPDLPPTAVADASPRFGPAPLAVQFLGSGSSDPESQSLTYHWDFGDGTSSTLADPMHIFYVTSDVTAQGTIIARMFELSPPHPLGGGNQDPEVIRDGDAPPYGSFDFARQYDTYHGGTQGNLDWIGYSFPAPHVFHALVFQEGIHGVDGGWFEQMRVQVGDGTTWSFVQAPETTPSYLGESVLSFATYRIDFAPIAGTHIRLAGTPGGADKYISVAELRVIAHDPAAATQPLRRDVVLTVRDPSDTPSTDALVVSLNNTPPMVQITSPVDGSTYPLGQPITPALVANVTDLEHGPGQLKCAWQTILHHDEHTHPDPFDPSCTSSTVITPIGCDGPTYWYEVALTVTDAAGLSGEDHVFLYPACTPEVVCAGDGSAAACPCGNLGAPGRGCENSFTTGGGALAAGGSARLSSDSLLLAATGLPPTTSALFYQGSTLVADGAGVAFGDGLRCGGGAVVRLATRMSVAGACSLGAPAGDAPLSAATGLSPEGGSRIYQAWYRNTASFCTSATFNLTNAVRVTWIP